MAPPYGTCDNKMARGTRSHCLLQCQREALDDLCQCYDVYMTNDTGKDMMLSAIDELYTIYYCVIEIINNSINTDINVLFVIIREISFHYRLFIYILSLIDHLIF